VTDPETGINNCVLATLNVPSKIKGAEIELYTRPHDNLDLGFGLSLLDARAYELGYVYQGQIITWDYRKMMQAPDYTFNGQITWRLPLSGGDSGAIELHTNFNVVAEQNYDPFNGQALRQDPYTYAYASVKYRPRSQNWEMYLWTRNALDEFYRRGGDDFSATRRYHSIAINPPRWYGLTFRYNFNL
jgi:outer membrane receptor protein involved in Fe transport